MRVLSKKCGLCGSSLRLLKGIGKDLRTYHCCQHCQLISVDSQNYLTKAAEKSRYSAHDNSMSNSGYVQMFDTLITEAILPIINPGEPILDYGSGPGPVLAQLLQEKKFRTTCYDPYFANNLDWQKEKYQLITMTEVIEHISDPLVELKKLLPFLLQNGYLLVTTYFHPEDDHEFLKWWYRSDQTHITFYTPQTMTVLAELAGLKLVYAKGKDRVLFQKV